MTTAEPEHQYWIRALEKVDRLLDASSRTLIDVAQWSEKKRQLSVPLFLSDQGVSPPKKYILVHALYASTIQRLYGMHRRFPFLAKRREELRKLAADMPKRLLPHKLTKRQKLSFIEHLGSDLFGALNPLTSSEVFWSFIRAGEEFAHNGVGFLAFFGILWALGRRHPNKSEAGAALEPSGPTATTTAKCLIAVRSLCDALTQRAGHYRVARKLVTEIEEVAGRKGPHATWTFAFKLDLLAGELLELSPYTIIPSDFVKAGEFLLKKTESLDSESDTAEVWEAARKRIKELLQKLDARQKEIFGDSKTVVTSLFPKIVACLGPRGKHPTLRKFCIKLADPGTRAYWDDHARSANRARMFCGNALATLQKPFARFKQLKNAPVPSARTLANLFEALSKSNVAVATSVNHFVEESVQWCRRVIDEETARASAGNLTEFDPAGLISAITVAQKWGVILRSEAEEGIRRALVGAMDDGSWMRGQPMFLDSRVLGMWPHTPDIVWMLAVAVNSAPSITVADGKLLAFVDWLERTRTKFEWKDTGEIVEGWSSELDRLPNILDFWNTCVSVNALLEIRELIEMRLWQTCQRRFTVIPKKRSLEDVAPVDLGAAHGRRLHRRLMRMARLTELHDTYEKEDYAIVLHGPPGSSKTAIVEGLGAEMWRRSRDRMHMIRITPSDFTRQGEDGLDSEAGLIFELLSHVRCVTILFDEIDDFLRQRSVETDKPSFIQLITPAMLNRIQDLRDAAPRQELCFVLAMNFVDKVEPALLRPGRIDSVVPVAYPDAWSRQAILEKNVTRGRINMAKMNFILEKTVAWPWSTFNKLAKEIDKRRSVVTVAWLEKQIKRFADQVQNSDHYYLDESRWKKKSVPLANEYVHLAFCESKDIGECRKALKRLEKIAPQDWLEDIFNQQVSAEGRA